MEIENFYNFDQPRVTCARYMLDSSGGGSLAEYSPSQQFPASTFQSGGLSPDDKFWAPLQGKFRRTIHQGRLSENLRRLLPPQHQDSFCMIVTDQEIEPPSGWRYIIWDEVPHGEVISVAPTDPLYWRERTSNREGAIKHRVRTAGLNIAGVLLGLTRCDNTNCFLFDDVASTAVLDNMLVLGKEHGWTSLDGMGYTPRPRIPAMLQSMTKAPLLDEEHSASPAPLAGEWNIYE